ncbi:DUF5038 domain-containing protein [Muricomes intestini]|jgi:hypothetical protein|uniref:DUF5038 domain-containing protein n=1 Tax=Muricomes intestini TaxID=1796634 RepID=UPI000E7FC762|nr:hypothetical protein [Lachnospiraceae bacterium]
MRLKKKEIIFIISIFICLILFFVGSAFYIKNSAQKVAKKETKQEVKKAATKDTGESEAPMKNKELTFEGFSLLESSFSEVQTIELEKEITDFLSQDVAYNSVTTVTCKEEAVQTENRIEFYCILNDENSTVLQAIYDRNSEKFRFWTEVISGEEIEQSWEEKQDSIMGTKEWEEEEKLPSEWEYEDKEPVPVDLSQKQLLDGKIPKENLDMLGGEMLKFLQENNELRREISIQNSVKDTEEVVEFWGGFDTPRLDKKELHIMYDKSGKNFQFALQED